MCKFRHETAETSKTPYQNICICFYFISGSKYEFICLGSRKLKIQSEWWKNAISLLRKIDRKFFGSYRRQLQLQRNACLSQPFYSFPAIYIKIPLKWLNYVEVIFTSNIDHTFNVSCNVGRFQLNKRSIQYEWLFLVLNESGQMLAWQLTRGTSFKRV